MRLPLTIGIGVLILPFLYDGQAQSLEYVRRAQQAATANNWHATVEFLRAAEERTTDPGLVAYNLGIAYYHLGRYREAELHFRRALEDADGDRLIFGWFGLANALAQRSGGNDPELLQQAARAYRICARLTRSREQLHTRAKKNLELCLLLLEQAPKPSPAKSSSGTQGQHEKSPKENGAQQPQQSGTGKGGRDGKKVEDFGPEGEPPDSKDRLRPGKGKLPVLADDSQLQRLSPEDVEALLRSAWRRIDEARQKATQRRRNPVTNVPDW